MPDPYKVLGVSPSASDDEIKKAYHELVKRYHPDAHPGDKQAEQKMKEINAAYDAITNKDSRTQARQNAYRGQSGGYSYGGGSSSTGGSSYGGSPYGGSTYDNGQYGGNTYGGGSYGWPFGGYSTQNDSPRMTVVREYLNQREYAAAKRTLDSIPEHTARWHYYYAMASQGLGDSSATYAHAQQAVSMDPSNLEYRMYYESLNSTTSSSTHESSTVEPFGCGTSFFKWVVVMLVLNLVLNLLLQTCTAGVRMF